MKKEDIAATLDWFQRMASKTQHCAGFTVDNCSLIFGIIIEMRHIVVAAEKQDLILIHKHFGNCAWYIANYCTLHNMNLAGLISQYSHLELYALTNDEDMEFYLQQVKDDMIFIEDMTPENKIDFMRKCWISTFPDDYHDDFLKVDKILRQHIEDNKIKNPEAFI